MIAVSRHTKKMALDLGAQEERVLASLEVWTPYLYSDLAELTAQLPGSAHTAGAGKAVLRRILGKRLRSASMRRKTAFEVPLATWLRGPLRDLLEDRLASGALFDEGWFERRVITGLVRDHLDHGRDRSGALWPLVCLAVWHDGVTVRTAS